MPPVLSGRIDFDPALPPDRDYLVQREKLPPSQFRLIYNGLAESSYQDLPSRPSARRSATRTR